MLHDINTSECVVEGRFCYTSICRSESTQDYAMKFKDVSSLDTVLLLNDLALCGSL
jgi:hypothetical protein